MIKQGDRLPSITFQLMQDGAVQNLTTEDIFAGKKVVLFAVPGAFTPTCSQAHLPGYVTLADKIKAAGVDEIVCLSVNDAFVMAEWGKQQNASEVMMLADGGADFTKAAGLEMETGAFGGVRSVRYAMIVEDGVITTLNVEEPKEFKISDAETILAALA